MKPRRLPVRVKLALGGLVFTMGLAVVGAMAQDDVPTSEPSVMETPAETPGAEPTAAVDETPVADVTPMAEGAPEATATSEPAADEAGTISFKQYSTRESTSAFGSRAVSLLGVLVLLGLCWLASQKRKDVSWRLVAVGIGLQFAFALLVLKTAPGRWLFDQLNDAVVVLLGFTNEGANFIFGSFSQGGQITTPLDTFAFLILPTIIFFSSLMTILYYFGIMQVVVKAFAVVMTKAMGVSGAESLSASANIFVGQTEAPLVIKPYVEKMTMSELMVVMTGGFATVAGGVMAAYVGMLRDTFPEIAGHLIAASVMSAPAALVAAKIMLPETEEPLTKGEVKMHVEEIDANAVDAAARGAGDGLKLALNVGAMLLAFIALVAMFNFGFKQFGAWTGIEGLSLETLFGYAFWPVAWIMGVPAEDCTQIGTLLGVKMVVNEFVAYLQLGAMLKDPNNHLSVRSVVIATYALCGFANFSSIAIQIGGIGGIAPSRRSDLARIGVRAMFAGTLAAFMTATIAGVLV